MFEKGDFTKKKLENRRKQQCYDLFKKLRAARDSGETVYFNAAHPDTTKVIRWKTVHSDEASRFSVCLYRRQVVVLDEWAEKDGKFHTRANGPICASHLEDFGFCIPASSQKKEE